MRVKKARAGNVKRRLPNGMVEEIIEWVNPKRDTLSNAERVSKGFHGRDKRDVTEVVETLRFAENLAELGDLREIECADDGLGYVVPIVFESKGNSKVVKLACTTDRKQLLLVGGDQKVDYRRVLEELEMPDQGGKQLVDLGIAHTISYFTDKHHLEGPGYQKDGCEYIHEFGEEGGDKPRLVYDVLNERLLIVGGSYVVKDTGIWD